MSFRRFSWYLSRVFTLVVVILTLIFVIVFKGVFSFIITLSSSFIRLLVPYNGRNGLELGTTTGFNIYNFNTYSFDIYSPGAYNLPI